MDAIILAAGRGERMRPLTDSIPKPLLNAGGQTLIEHHLNALYRAEFRNIVINLAYRGQQIEDLLGNGRQYGVTISYSHEPEGALETAGGIINALSLIGSDEFLVINGDIWTEYDYSPKPLRPPSQAHLVLVDNPHEHPNGDFKLCNGNVVNRAIGDNSLTFAGIGYYRKRFFRGLSVRRRPMAPLLRQAADDGSVTGEHFRGKWMDIGTPKRLEALQNYLDSNKQNDIVSTSL